MLQQNFIQFLPRHILNDIFEFLTVEEILNFRQVNYQIYHQSKQFANIKHQSYWPTNNFQLIDLQQFPNIRGLIIYIKVQDSGIIKAAAIANYEMKLLTGQIQLSFYDNANNQFDSTKLPYIFIKNTAKLISKEYHINDRKLISNLHHIEITTLQWKSKLLRVDVLVI